MCALRKTSELLLDAVRLIVARCDGTGAAGDEEREASAVRALRNPQLREHRLIVKAGTLIFMHHDCVHRACRSEPDAPFRAMIAIRNAVRVSDPTRIAEQTDEPRAVDWPAGRPNAQHTALWRYLQGYCSQPLSSDRWPYDPDLSVAVARGESEGLDAAFQMAAAAANGDETAAEMLVNAATKSADEAVRRAASYALTAAGTSDPVSGQHAVMRLIGVLERGAEALEVPSCEHGDLIDRKMNVLVMVVHALGQLAGCTSPTTAARAARAIGVTMERCTQEIEHWAHTLPKTTRLLYVASRTYLLFGATMRCWRTSY